MTTPVSGNGYKRAILYARVSTDEQAEKGYSLPSQFDAMRKYAAQQGFEIAAEFQDDYSGATPIEHRPEGRKAYAMLQSGAADVIIAYTIDRFVRPPEDGDEWEMPILIRGLAKLGKEIHTVRRGKLNTNFADLLIALLDARKAGEERRDIRERSMRGKRQKVKSGKVIGMRAPFGYRYVRDAHGKVVTLEIDETTARIVRLIFKWYVHGDEHGKRLSVRAIAFRLSEMCITPPGELQRGYKFRKHGKRVWTYSTIGCMLKSEVYAGVWRYGFHIPKRNDFTEPVVANVPAIVGREMWEQAQAQRKRNQELSLRNTKHEYLLSGLIRCGLCGIAFGGETHHDHQYYGCTYGSVRVAKFEGRCANRLKIRADAIEVDVWDEIRELFRDLDRLWVELKRAQQNEIDAVLPIRERLQITDDFITQAEHNAAKIARALEDAERGGAVYKALKRDEIEVNASLDALAKQREKHLQELGACKLTNQNIEMIMDFARKVRKGIDKATFNTKRRYLEVLDVRVTITPGKYHLKCIVGEKDGEISQIKRFGVRIVPNSSRSPIH